MFNSIYIYILKKYTLKEKKEEKASVYNNRHIVHILQMQSIYIFKI